MRTHLLTLAVVLAATGCQIDDERVDPDPPDDTDVTPPDAWPDRWPAPTAGAWSDTFAFPGFVGESAARIEAVVETTEGHLVVAGVFDHVTDAPIRGVARFDGDTWTQVADGIDGVVTALLLADDGTLYAGGYTSGFLGVSGFVKELVPGGTAWTDIAGFVDDRVLTLAWLPSGDLAIGGAFNQIGGVEAPALALWDGVDFASLGAPFAPWSWSSVLSVFSWDDATCITGGFEQVAGQPAGGVACYDGVSWTPRGSLNNDVYGVAQLGDGRTMAWGAFAHDLGPPNFQIGLAVWNGEDWAPVAEGGVHGGLVDVVRDLQVTDDGYRITGQFKSVGHGTDLATGASYVAAWDGTSWSTVGGGVYDTLGPYAASVPGGYMLHEQADGTLWLAGLFHRTADAVMSGLTRSDGDRWTSPFGVSDAAPLEGVSTAAAVARDGTTWVGAAIAAWGYEPRLVSWDGTAWAVTDDAPAGALERLWSDETGLVRATGTLTLADGSPCDVARYDADGWSCEIDGLDGLVLDMATAPDGSLVLAGGLTGTVARWDGETVRPIGEGLVGIAGTVATAPDGTVYAHGTRLELHGEPVRGVVAWDGERWDVLGHGLGGTLYDLAWVDGKLLIGGSYMRPLDAEGQVPPDADFESLLAWDGTTFASWGDPSAEIGYGFVHVLHVWDGGLYVAGLMDEIGGVPVRSVAWYDGTTFHDLGGGLDDLVTDIAVGPDEVWFAGAFRQAGDAPSFGVARWDLVED